MNKGLWVGLMLAVAQVAPASETGVGGLGLDIDPDMLTEHFLSSHPDLRWQREGMHSMDQGHHEIALDQFKRAARYGDKLSQAQIANMYWEGIGVERDRALAYAWMDIAAERLYPDLIAFRERFWAELGPREREEAIERGQAILAEYGDDVAKPRLEEVLQRARRSITGGRLGAVGNVRVIPFTGPGRHRYSGELNLAGATSSISGHAYYADEFWKAEQYWEMQDRAWNAPDREGRVDVGDPAMVRKPGDE